jgi:hypothetical protein
MHRRHAPVRRPAPLGILQGISASGGTTMSFALYMIGFVIFLGGLIWGASVAGVPTLYIGIGAVILLGIGIFSAVGRTRGKDPS